MERLRRPSKRVIIKALLQVVEKNGWQVLWQETAHSDRKVYKAR